MGGCGVWSGWVRSVGDPGFRLALLAEWFAGKGLLFGVSTRAKTVFLVDGCTIFQKLDH